MAYQRPQAATLAERLAEPRRFVQVVAGPRQVGMRPDSFLRQALAKQQRDSPLLLRMLSGSLVLANFGADFAGHQYTRWERFMQAAFVRLLRRSGSLPPVEFTRYLHHLARKS